PSHSSTTGVDSSSISCACRAIRLSRPCWWISVVYSPNASRIWLAAHVSSARPWASMPSSWRSRANSGSFSEKTKLAVSVGVKPRRARSVDSSRSSSRTGSQAGVSILLTPPRAAASRTRWRNSRLCSRSSGSAIRSRRAIGAPSWLSTHAPSSSRSCLSRTCTTRVPTSRGIKTPCASLRGGLATAGKETTDGIDENLWIDGIDEINVGAGGEAQPAMLRITVDAGLVNDRDGARRRVVLEASADLEAIDVRQRHVEHDDIRRAAGQAQRVATRGRLANVEARAGQDPGRRISTVRTIVDHQHRVHLRRVMLRRRAWPVKVRPMVYHPAS